MSTVFATRQKSQSSQLCFDWMEQGPRKQRSESHRQATPRTASPLRVPAPALPVRPAAIAPPQTQPANNPQRVGEARLGHVMIRLLKRYGITDAEIQAGLAEYAQSGGTLYQAS